ncbi:MAG: preprotein translocase subunit SecE [Polyangiales bacterium]
MSETSQETTAAPGDLGTHRRVQFAFMAIAGVFVLLAGKVVGGVADLVSEKFDTATLPPTAATAIGVVVGAIGAYLLYRNDGVRRFSFDVAGELQRVKWPDREETWSNTIVVIVTSVIAAVILFAFDYTWSAITDQIYKF